MMEYKKDIRIRIYYDNHDNIRVIMDHDHLWASYKEMTPKYSYVPISEIHNYKDMKSAANEVSNMIGNIIEGL